MTAPLRTGVMALAVVLAASPALAQSPPPGAASCSGCHAPPGAGSIMPGLAGWPAENIAAAMIAFRDDELPSTVMGRIAKGFSDEEITAIAEWLAAQEEPPKDARP